MLAELALKRWVLKRNPPQEDRKPQHQKQVGEDRTGDRGFHYLELSRRQSHPCDDQLGGVAESGIQEPAYGTPGAGCEFLGGPAHPTRQRQKRQGRYDKDPYPRSVQQLEH